MSELLERAFAALGAGPSDRELALVVEALQRAGDNDAVRILRAARDLDDGFAALTEVATACGSSGFVALDLVTTLWMAEECQPDEGRRRADRSPG